MTAAHVRQAMVLAAGRGERLRPLTDTCPKPLVTIGDRPLIIHQLSRLAHAGFERVVINLGWLGEQIPKAVAPWLSNAPLNQLEIHYSQEPPGALETAGGIRHALDFFEPGALAVISADVWCEFDYRQLTMHALKKSAHLVLVKNPPHHPHGDFVLDGDQVRLAGPGTGHTLTYSGMGIFSTDLFATLSPGHRPLRPVLEQAIELHEVTGEHFLGHWVDIGTHKRLAQAQQSACNQAPS